MLDDDKPQAKHSIESGDQEMNSHESIPLNTIVPSGTLSLPKAASILDDDRFHKDEPNAMVQGETISDAKQKAEHVIAWLRAEYQINQGTSISRSAVFGRYLEVCQMEDRTPVNPATFGKVIRAVFPALKTRRLGARGSSKYHYYGIAPRNHTTEESLSMMILSTEPSQKRSTNSITSTSHEGGLSIYDRSNDDNKDNRGDGKDHLSRAINHHNDTIIKEGYTTLRPITTSRPPPPSSPRRRRRSHKSTRSESQSEAFSPTNSSFNQGSTEPTPTAPVSTFFTYEPLIPDFDEFARFLEQICQPIPNNIRIHPYVSLPLMHNFSRLYQSHVRLLLKLIADREFALVEGAVLRFWNSLPLELVPCLHTDEGLRVVSLADDYLYQVAIHILVPDVLEPLPLPISQSIRYFAKALDLWHFSIFAPFITSPINITMPSTIFPTNNSSPLTTIPSVVANAKLDLVRRFTQVLRRRTALNHLAQAVRGILGETIPSTPSADTILDETNDQQLYHRKSLLQDLTTVDWNGIREQTSWLMPGQGDFLSYMEGTMKAYLHGAASIGQWAGWMESLMEQTMVREMAMVNDLEAASRIIALRWSMITGLMARDLTLRSAQSFGSFHLLRLFLDEYLMFYLERKLDESRRALGLASYWPSHTDSTTTTPLNQPSHKEGPIIGDSEFSFEKVMAGFTSMEELFRRSGLLAFCQAINHNGTTNDAVSNNTGNSHS